MIWFSLSSGLFLLLSHLRQSYRWCHTFQYKGVIWLSSWSQADRLIQFLYTLQTIEWFPKLGLISLLLFVHYRICMASLSYVPVRKWTPFHHNTHIIFDQKSVFLLFEINKPVLAQSLNFMNLLSSLQNEFYTHSSLPLLSEFDVSFNLHLLLQWYFQLFGNSPNIYYFLNRY